MSYYDDMISGDGLQDDIYVMTHRQLMETKFPTHEILSFSRDEYLVFYHSILAERERIDQFLSSDAETAPLMLYGGTYPGSIQEKDMLSELLFWLKENSLYLESCNIYLVPMPYDWQQRMLAFIRGAALLFRNSLEQLV